MSAYLLGRHLEQKRSRAGEPIVDMSQTRDRPSLSAADQNDIVGVASSTVTPSLSVESPCDTLNYALLTLY